MWGRDNGVNFVLLLATVGANERVRGKKNRHVSIPWNKNKIDWLCATYIRWWTALFPGFPGSAAGWPGLLRVDCVIAKMETLSSMKHDVEPFPLSKSILGSSSFKFPSFMCSCLHVVCRWKVDISLLSGAAESWWFLLTHLQSLVTLLWRHKLWLSALLALPQVTDFPRARPHCADSKF